MGKQQFCVKPLAAGLILSGVLTLTGCGGSGGGGSTAAVPPTTVTGVAATGVPMANATVTLTDATGATRTATTGADGSYSFDVAALTAPFVIKASGAVNDTTVTLISVQDTAPASGKTITVNVTPLTHAIAAALSASGDPLALDAKTDGAAIKSKIADVKNFVAQTLAPTLAAAGVDTAKFDPVNTAFKADRTGLDKALDNIRVQVAPDGTVSMSNRTAVAKVNDAAESSTAPATSLTANNSTVVTFSKNDDLKAKVKTTPKLEGSVEDSSVADNAVAAFNACFKLPAAKRSTDPACTNLVSSAYKNNGLSAAQELGDLWSNPAMDNAVFNKPKVIRFLYSDPAKPADRVVVKITWTRADGTVGSITTVAKNFGTGVGWKLDGNQRSFLASANAAINRIETTSSAANPKFPGMYASGVNFYVSSSAGNAANTISWVKVTGPGLPAAGIVLKHSTGTCAYLTIVSKTGNTAAPQLDQCTSIYKMTGIALDGKTGADKVFADATDSTTATGAAYVSYAPGKVGDSALAAVKPFDAYTFQIHDNSGKDVYLVERLRSRPMTLAELTSSGMSKKWYTLDAATKASLDPTNKGKFTGGAQFPMAWVRPDGTPPVYAVNVQFRTDSQALLVEANPRVPLTATSFKVNAPSGKTFPAATATAGGFQMAQVVARNSNDMQIFSTLRYDNF